MPTIIELNKKYNNFTVLELMPNKKASNGQAYYVCECICGQIREVRKDNIGKIKGCGCSRSDYQARKTSIKPEVINRPKPFKRN